MRDANRLHPIARKPVVLLPPSGFHADIRKGIHYDGEGDDSRTLDLYYPADAGRRPAVLFVSGLSDVGARAVLGCRINEMASFRDWATLVASAGLVGVTYTTGADTTSDARSVIRYLQASGQALGLESGAIGLWSCSSHVPNALALLMNEPTAFQCAVMLYGFMLDLDGFHGVAEAERVWHFANPARNRTMDDLPSSIPLFIARAGRDATPYLNESLDRFVGHALSRNLPLTLINYANSSHALDLDEHDHSGRDVVRQTLMFLRSRLLRNQNVKRLPAMSSSAAALRCGTHGRSRATRDAET